MMELRDLTGLHRLSGVEFNVAGITKYRDEMTISFCLDGKTYTVIEDAEDSYRSSMREIIQSDINLSNIFTPIWVMCIMREYPQWKEQEVLDIYDVQSALRVLSVGTDHTDSYYPIFVAEWIPKNMAINHGKEGDFYED